MLGSLPSLEKCCLVWDDIDLDDFDLNRDATLTVATHSLSSTGSLTLLGCGRPLLLEPGSLDACGPLRDLRLFGGTSQAMPLAIAGIRNTIQCLTISAPGHNELRLGDEAVATLLECASLEELALYGLRMGDSGEFSTETAKQIVSLSTRFALRYGRAFRFRC